ncbi:MAG: hypothetical protein SGI83_13550 [Bacteroidota bacterium]|nr:hypothetical protein [Bacteroidota bacterium]
MKIKHQLSGLILLVSTVFFTGSAAAQKERTTKIEQLAELPKSKTHITKELEARIIETVKPVLEQIEKLLSEDGSGNYALYKDEVRKVNEAKSADEKMLLLQKIQKNFYPFIKSIWDQAKIDDNQYQQKIKGLFPDHLKETIRFKEFLNFTISSSSQKPIPPPPPKPSNTCVDANTLFKGLFGIDGGAIGSVQVQVAPARPPSPAEIVVGAGAAIIGFYRGQGWIRNTITIPGTFPSDSRSLRSKKTFDWRGTASAASIAGCSWSTVAYSSAPNDTDFRSSGEIYTAVAPVIFLCIFTKKASKTEEAVFSKTDLTGLQFGLTCYGSATSSIFLSHAHAHSAAAIIKWEVCEE